MVIPIETFIGLMGAALVFQFLLERSKHNFTSDEYRAKRLACETFKEISDPQELEDPVRAKLRSQLNELLQPIKADPLFKDKIVELQPNIKSLFEAAIKLLSDDNKEKK